MEKVRCSLCQDPKANQGCGLCQAILCKKCAVLLEKGSFAFLTNLPGDLTHKYYCGPCYDAKVAGELANYRQTMGRARAVHVFDVGQGEETRLIKRKEKPVKVVDCDDQKETLLRLAFLAAQKGFNALVDVDISSKKVRKDGYQSTLWQGAGIPVNIDPSKYESH